MNPTRDQYSTGLPSMVHRSWGETRWHLNWGTQYPVSFFAHDKHSTNSLTFDLILSNRINLRLWMVGNHWLTLITISLSTLALWGIVSLCHDVNLNQDIMHLTQIKLHILLNTSWDTKHAYLFLNLWELLHLFPMYGLERRVINHEYPMTLDMGTSLLSSITGLPLRSPMIWPHNIFMVPPNTLPPIRTTIISYASSNATPTSTNYYLPVAAP